MVAVEWDGSLFESRDRGSTWEAVDTAPNLIEVEWLSSGPLIGIDARGFVWQTDSSLVSWRAVGQGPTDPQALHITDGGRWLVATEDGSIVGSADDGESWTDVYMPRPRIDALSTEVLRTVVDSPR